MLLLLIREIQVFIIAVCQFTQSHSVAERAFRESPTVNKAEHSYCFANFGMYILFNIL